MADGSEGGQRRVKHERRLRGLFVQVLGLLSADGLITLERVMQDGTKSERRRPRIVFGASGASAQASPGK